MRKDLSMFELAEALKMLIEEYHLTQDTLAKRLSTSQSNIANKLRLLRFTSKERLLLEEYHLTERHARALLRLHNEKTRVRCLVFVGEHHLSVKATEDYIDAILLPKSRAKTSDHSISGRDALDFVRGFLKKPLLRLGKKGVSVQSEEVEDDTSVKIIITIPKDREFDEECAFLATHVSRETTSEPAT